MGPRHQRIGWNETIGDLGLGPLSHVELRVTFHGGAAQGMHHDSDTPI